MIYVTHKYLLYGRKLIWKLIITAIDHLLNHTCSDTQVRVQRTPYRWNAFATTTYICQNIARSTAMATFCQRLGGPSFLYTLETTVDEELYSIR